MPDSDDTEYEWEVMVTADVEHTPRVTADSPDDAEDEAAEYIREEYGATPENVTHETELSDGRHQVCVWAERHFYPTATEATEADALEAAKEEVQREHSVQTSDIRGTSARKIREVPA
ncbi:hypothetical protein [Natrinema gari]|uniref:Uncharacterized protein n=1 Tax=Natrinema gari JCM 14663 TaxID=1230459 RepID=L9ZJB8_9EURY|nr:hypothetical protein [Natrinema gari]ELY85263.1 hypothetical protein C486_00185 [Natrinema gari JCM 14663]